MAVYNSRNVFASKNSKVRLITPITEFALFTFSLIWFSKVNLLSLTTHISFSNFENSIALRSSFSLYANKSISDLPILMHLHLSGWKQSNHFSDHNCMALMSS